MLLEDILLNLGFKKDGDCSDTHQDFTYRIDKYKVLTIRHFFEEKNFLNQPVTQSCRFFYSGGHKDFNENNAEVEIKKLLEVLSF